MRVTCDISVEIVNYLLMSLTEFELLEFFSMGYQAFSCLLCILLCLIPCHFELGLIDPLAQTTVSFKISQAGHALNP